MNAIIRQALAIPSFTLVIVDPDPKSDFYKALSEQKDPRIWVSKGTTLGTFSGFVQYVLPDLHEEGIQMKVLKTHEALGNTPQAQRGVTDG
ncbi:MAG: hypothetical protein N3E49_03215 [Bacteroidia bacterium]|nr:hypothetical protein [Bacteroidia bacterium]